MRPEQYSTGGRPVNRPNRKRKSRRAANPEDTIPEDTSPDFGCCFASGDEPWTIDDRNWFAKHPERRHRLRALFPGEAADAGQHVAVQLLPNDELFIRVAADFGAVHVPDDNEELAQALFSMFERGGDELLDVSEIETIIKHSNRAPGPAIMVASVIQHKQKTGHQLFENGFGLLDFKQKASDKKFKTYKNGKPIADDQGNVRLALEKLDVIVRHDRFQDRSIVSGLEGFDLLDDRAADRLWLTIDKQFAFRPTKDFFWTVVADEARRNSFHPVLDYLDALHWDGVQRIDRWLIDNAGAENTPYVRAVGTLMLVAGVRRIRKPGCKFDEMPVLISKQGLNKSTALATLAVKQEWFSDNLPLNADAKTVIERVKGRWIMEAAELNGMRKGEVQHLKSFLSRTIDRARMSMIAPPASCCGNASSSAPPTTMHSCATRPATATIGRYRSRTSSSTSSRPTAISSGPKPQHAKRRATASALRRSCGRLLPSNKPSEPSTIRGLK